MKKSYCEITNDIKYNSSPEYTIIKKLEVPSRSLVTLRNKNRKFLVGKTYNLRTWKIYWVKLG